MKEVAAAIQVARTEPSSSNLEAMWRHVMALPAWYLLPASLDGPSTPLVARLDDGDWIVAFTHFRTLNIFAREHEMRSDRGEVPMLPLPPADAVARVEEVAEHVDGVVFNPDSDMTFRAPTAALVEFASRFLDR